MTLSALITFLVVMVVLGLVVYLIETYLPLAAPFKLVIRVIVLLFLILYLLNLFGIYRLAAQTPHPCDITNPTTFTARRGQPIRLAWCHDQKDDDDQLIPLGQLHFYALNADNNNVIRDLGLMAPVGSPSASGDYYFETPQFSLQNDVRLNVAVEYNGMQAISATPIFLDIKGGPKAPKGTRIVLQ